LNKYFSEKMGNPLKLTDKYAWNNYVWHLGEAGLHKNAINLLSDYTLFPVSEEILLIQKALLLSASVINDDRVQLDINIRIEVFEEKILSQ